MNSVNRAEKSPTLPPRVPHAPVAELRSLDADSYRSARPQTPTAPASPPWWSKAARGALHVAGGSLVVLGNLPALLGGNLGILALHRRMAAKYPQPPIPERIPGIKNQHVVDASMLRGSAPHSAETYRALATQGVTTIVDLRAEHHVTEAAPAKTEALRKLGLDYVHIPIRDGQPPSEAEVKRFLEAKGNSEGRVFVHCGAGVGRTGSMVAAYLVQSGKANADEALRQMLSVGPPSLEQIAYVKGLDSGELDRPHPIIVGASRVLDAPRRIWSQLKHRL